MSAIFVRAAAALALVVTLSSCSGHRSSEPPLGSQSGDHNAADIAFAQNMIPHHRQAVDMAAMVPSRSTNPDVRVMATHISSDQQAEILTMTGLLAAWGAPIEADHGHHGDHGAMAMPGMIDDAALDQIRSMRGPAFDTLWITAMIDHHEGAITMAQTEIADGRNPDSIKLAELIINAQQREIAQMNNLVSARE